MKPDHVSQGRMPNEARSQDATQAAGSANRDLAQNPVARTPSTLGNVLPSNRGATPAVERSHVSAERHFTGPPNQSQRAAATNAQIVDLFNNGKCTAINVLKVTTSCLMKAKTANAALACIRELSRCNYQGQRVYPDTFVYTAAITACGNAGQVGKALELFDELKNKGKYFHPPVAPNTATYNAAITACGVAGQVDKALDLFKDLKNNGKTFNPPADLDTKAYTAAITACEKSEQADTALSLFDQLLDEGPGLESPAYPDEITYGSALAACEKAGRTDRYAELLRLGMGTPRTPGPRVFRPNLGFNPRKNLLDFHETAVLMHPRKAAAIRDKGVHRAVVKAIFHVLFTQPQVIQGPNAKGINDKTIFVVGQNGADLVKQTVIDCMSKPRSEGGPGWTPVPQNGHDGSINVGCLTVSEQPPDGARVRLNPNAAPFFPGR